MPDPIGSPKMFPGSSAVNEPDEPLTCDPGPCTCDAAGDHDDVERVSRERQGEPLRPQGSVWLCHRPVDASPDPKSWAQKAANVSAKLGGEHRFLVTPQRAAGMGPAGGGLPDGSAPIMQPTTLNDHRGQAMRPDADCEPVPNVDEDCVNEELRIGRPMGPWLPTVNDCHTVAEGILRSCTPGELEVEP